ncbi:MAG: FecR domain-containing protein, partial [Bacteroidota bacterium]
PTEYPDARHNFATAKAILLSIEEGAVTDLPSATEKEADFALLLQRMAEPANSQTPQASEREQKSTVNGAKVRTLWPRLAAVAAIVLLLVAGFLFLRPTPTLEYATGNSEQREIILSDGTVVNLNANSSLELLANDWDGGARIVDLSGEAFFDVKKQLTNGQQRSFIVRTQGAEIQVLGTRFNVRNRRGGDRIYLEEGAVRVDWKGAKTAQTDLLPGEIVVRESLDAQPVHQPVSRAGQEDNWKSGHLSFDHQPLRVALNEVEDIYGIELQCVNKLLEVKEITSAGIPVDNLQVALQLLETALGLRIEAQNDSSIYKVAAAE